MDIRFTIAYDGHPVTDKGNTVRVETLAHKLGVGKMMSISDFNPKDLDHFYLMFQDGSQL